MFSGADPVVRSLELVIRIASGVCQLRRADLQLQVVASVLKILLCCGRLRVAAANADVYVK
jgi:hypothetical protein